MVILGPLPASKLAFLAIKQFAKYISNYIRDTAKKKPIFRKYICMPSAQLYNWCEVKTKSLAMHLGHPVEVKPLREAEALELGALLLGEFALFFILAGVIMSEIKRQSLKESKNKLAEKRNNLAIINKLTEMNTIMDMQYNQIMNMREALKYLGQPPHEIYFVEPSEPASKYGKKKIKTTQATIESKTKQIQTDAIKN